jgi:tRNA modification GTPase
VIDGSTEPDTEDLEILRTAEKAEKGIVILSKRDISEKECAIKTVLPVVRVSSVTGEGLEELEKTIAEMFPLPDVPAGEILTNSRHAEAAGRALDYMNAAIEAMTEGRTPDIVLTETEGAMQAIGELNGRTIREDVTNRIFERFCVGK